MSPKVDGKSIEKKTEGKTLGEVEDRDPNQLRVGR